MSATKTFDDSPASIRLAREFARHTLEGYPPDVVETVTLMVSELATNCIRHTEGPFELRVVKGPSEIRIEATDRGAGDPRLRSPAPTDPSGRGLQIVDMLATAWGCDRHAGAQKTVWFTVAAFPKSPRRGVLASR